MDQLIAIMLLVGCNGNGSACAEIPSPVVSYSSVAECERALPLQMRFSSTADDRVIGSCVGVDAAVIEQSAMLEWGVTRAGTLNVAVVAREPVRIAQSPVSDETALHLASR